MKIGWDRYTAFALGMLTLTSAVSAAELRGRIWDAATGRAPNMGKIVLSCGGDPSPHPLVGSGTFSIRNVPNGPCTIKLSTSSGSASRNIAINKPVVQFNGETRKAGNKILLVPR